MSSGVEGFFIAGLSCTPRCHAVPLGTPYLSVIDSSIWSHMLVLTIPGQYALTLIPCGPSSMADACRASLLLLNLGGQSVEVFPLALHVVDDDIVSIVCEAKGYGSPNALRGSGYDGNGHGE
ncbi:unnamed protein product [Parascedosporium putredinis]|uniref:Uncharacterized protein n=1 Tax=Parascedosporium putredinis TaxID=1442378 RepID=A0A9P1MBU2_9PEZI|nr:unnamed protein product [Parascedosporium putredinis]CAI7996929.1 unnamed protein product [Parascedosporium putredinis]